MTHEEKLNKGINLLRSMHNDLIDLETILQMEKAGNPADSGFAEALEDVERRLKQFKELFPQD